MQKILKSIEVNLKALLKDSIFAKNRKTTPKRCEEKCEDIATAKRILLLRQDRIGDLLVTTSFLRNLRNAFPKTPISILLSERNIVAQSCIKPYCSEIFVLRKTPLGFLKLIKQLKKKKFELVIDLLDNPSVTSSILVRLLKTKFSLGFEKENKNIYTHIVTLPDKSKVHIVERIANFLIPFGLNPSNCDLSLEYPLKEVSPLPHKSMPRLGINISGSNRQKFWGAQNFITLINKIKSRFTFEILLFSTKDYLTEIKHIQSETNAKIANFTKDFDEFASLVASCDLLITPDTSVVHLASCFKIPVLVFFHYISAEFGMPWLPYKTKFRYLTSSKDYYSDIEPNKVFDEFCSLYYKVSQ